MNSTPIGVVNSHNPTKMFLELCLYIGISTIVLQICCLCPYWAKRRSTTAIAINSSSSVVTIATTVSTSCLSSPQGTSNVMYYFMHYNIRTEVIIQSFSFQVAAFQQRGGHTALQVQGSRAHRRNRPQRVSNRPRRHLQWFNASPISVSDCI